MNTLLGLAIGDALGQPFEFSSTEMIIKSGWTGQMKSSSFGFEGMWNLSHGQWTDDTKMALCITRSLLKKKSLDVHDLSKEYIDWLDSRDVRGIGTRTNRAIASLKRGVSPFDSGKKETERKAPSFKRKSLDPKETDTGEIHGIGGFCGCGTVMRCAPIGVYFRNNFQAMKEAAILDANITHHHPDARDSSIFLCATIGNLLNGSDALNAVKDALKIEYEYDHVSRLVTQAVELGQDESTTFVDGIKLGVNGTAHETLASAVYSFIRYDTFEDVVASSVLMGGDTDSRAAIAGAMAGSLYSFEDIKKDWINDVEDSEKIQALDKELFETSEAN